MLGASRGSDPHLSPRRVDARVLADEGVCVAPLVVRQEQIVISREQPANHTGTGVIQGTE